MRLFGYAAPEPLSAGTTTERGAVWPSGRI